MSSPCPLNSGKRELRSGSINRNVPGNSYLQSVTHVMIIVFFSMILFTQPRGVTIILLKLRNLKSFEVTADTSRYQRHSKLLVRLLKTPETMCKKEITLLTIIMHIILLRGQELHMLLLKCVVPVDTTGS